MKRRNRNANQMRPGAFHFVDSKPGLRAAVRRDGVLEMLVYDEIGFDYWTGSGITAKSVRQQIDGAGIFASILLRINSPGGDAFEGVAIGNILKATGKPVDVMIDGIAASAASIIAMCGSTITMASNAMMMIHDAWSICMGASVDMAKMADTLAKIDVAIAQTYVDRTGKSMDDVKAMMDEETWMSAPEAKEAGFCTAIAEEGDGEDAPMAMARRFKSLARFKKTPPKLKAEKQEDPDECDCDCSNCVAGDCENCTNEDCRDENCEDCPMKSGANAAATIPSPTPAAEPSVASNLSLHEAEWARRNHKRI